MKDTKQIRNITIIFFILLAVIIFTLWFDQKKKSIDIGFPLENIALKANGWEGVNIPAIAQEKEWVDQGDLIVRDYHRENEKIYLVAIQERGDRHRVHSPVDCYSGSGWLILKKEDVTIGKKRNRKTVRRMRVLKDKTPRLVYYWFSNGESSSPGFKGHLLCFLKDIALKGSIKSWVCFQVSADIKTNVRETDDLLENFISSLEL